jgi:hypothetical protein
MSMTSSSYLAVAIFPASFGAHHPWTDAERAVRDLAPAEGMAGLATFPPAFLAFLGALFLLAPGDASLTADRVSLGLGLVLAALVWVALLLVVALHAAPVRVRQEGR